MKLFTLLALASLADSGYFVDLSRTLTLTRYGQSAVLFRDGSTCADVRCTSSTHCEMKINGGAIPVCLAGATP